MPSEYVVHMKYRKSKKEATKIMTTTSWVEAAYWVKDHGYCMVHIPTGNRVTKRKTAFYIDTLEEIELMQGEGYTDQEITKAVPGAKKVSRTDCVLLDAVTANMLRTVYEALNDEQKKKFRGIPIDKAVTIGWKCIK